MYRMLFDHLISKTDPEVAHAQSLRAIALAGASEAGRRALRASFGRPPQHPVRSQRLAVFPRAFPGYVGLAAGMDKNATAVLGLAALGFSHVEIGTVTRHPQPGNEPPRMWRHMDERAIRNKMGFNNDGADIVAGRLAELRASAAGRRAIVGVNIGKSKITPAEDARHDYEYSASTLSHWADYLVINVSSPNTPGLRDLQAVGSLKPIVGAVQSAASRSSGRDVPLLVKIAPDLSDEGVADIATLIKTSGVTGMVATNTTIAHPYGEGGLSGRPLKERALQVVKLARAELGLRPVLIGVGGIETPADGRAMLDAGADLLQAYSGFVYGGPSWPGMMNRELAR
ncbi:dihydroorotate dehydrogenase (quinone) [Bowdeniella nasicola]|uniref:Dihydroorotate dehydrogenase (quinone) n=1 Tax=Bowdeniella nasicola TaxID=208480 RepID=A0A1Q5Q3L7_9ACTO|nr:quinone-dependent dihydroorotate dehydrogenase [Bowdeniella nasicola]OKL54230.1 dihydroorotate dehydrogenase (quinone) [Bowdeniella nasicola]